MSRPLIRGAVPVPQPTPNNHQEVLRLLKQNIDSLTGQSDPLARAVTVGDLGTISLSEVLSGAVGVVAGGGGGGGSTGGGSTYDPTTDNTVPPAPTGVQALGGYDTIIVRWNVPPSTYKNPSYAEVFASPDTLRSNAVLVGRSSTTFFPHQPGANQTRYYWVRFVSQANITGPDHHSAGVQAATAVDVPTVLAALADQITSSALLPALRSRIDLIDAPASTAGSVNARVQVVSDGLAGEVSTRATQVTHLAGQYSVRTQVSGNGQTVVGGYGLAGSSGGTAGPTISFGVAANTFFIAPPAGQNVPSTVPFIVRTTATTEGGQTVPAGVYMDAAFVVNLTALYARIQSLVATQITATQINVSQLVAGNLAADQYIQSSNFSSGALGTGFRLSANGDAELSAALIRGTLQGSRVIARGLTIYAEDGVTVLFNGGSAAPFDWSRVANRPTTLGALDSAAGTKLNGIEAGATVGAPVGTPVQGQFPGGTSAGGVEDWAYNGQLASENIFDPIIGLATRLRGNAQNVLAGPGGISTGTLTWDVNGNYTGGVGVGLTRAGIVAYNALGNPTFTLNGTNGSATFGGSLAAATGTFAGALAAATGTFAGALSAATGTFSGSLSAATGTFSGSLTADAVNAVSTINLAGNAVTIPAGAENASAFSFSTSDAGTELLSISFDSGGFPVAIFASVFGTVASANGSTTFVRVYIDNTLVMSRRYFQPSSYSDNPNLSISWTGVLYIPSPGTGLKNYRIFIMKQGGSTAKNFSCAAEDVTMVVMGLKR